MLYDIKESKETLGEAIRIAKIYDKTIDVQGMNLIKNYISALFDIDTEIVDALFKTN